METFILVYFIVLVIGVGNLLYDLNSKEYPYKTETTRGTDFIALILSSIMAIWAGYLIF